MFIDMDNFIQQHIRPDSIFIVGGGPSLNKINLDQLNANHIFTIACNQAFQLLPNATIAHHSDFSWWKAHKISLENDFTGKLITGCGLGTNQNYPNSSSVYKLNTIRFDNKHEFLINHDLVYGNNCGLQAVSLAHFFIPKNIILIGFDFKADQDNTHGYHQAEPQSAQSYEKFWQQFLKDFTIFESLRKKIWSSLHPDVELPHIYNLNPDSALKLYDHSKKLEDFL